MNEQTDLDCWIGITEQGEDDVLPEELGLLVGVGNVLAAIPVVAGDDYSALGLIVHFDQVNMIFAGEIGHELHAGIGLVYGFTDPSHYDSLVALSLSGSVDGRSIMLVGVSGNTLGL